MTSTTARSTPSLTVPSTQNTAPVLEFGCLYTHDLRRKSKRWQDGFLRFHTFNKRVMVYDIPRNFIGDMHWRRGGMVEDGDELELEKGVLVQVGEAVGSMEQDLAELFEKRRVPNESPRPKKATAPCSSSGNNAATPFTQLRPKPLNALLGTPRGRYGRAILPTLSPYEERHQAKSPSDPEEGRSVKRQKINLRPLNTTSQQSPLIARAKPSLPDRRPIPDPTAKLAKSVVRRQDLEKIDAIEVVSSNGGPPERGHNFVRHSLAQTSKQAIATRNRPASSLFCSSSPPVSTTNHLPRANAVTSIPHAPTEPSAARGPVESDDSVPVNPLRPAARRARKKLMYKDLLPPKQPPSSNEPDSTSPTGQTARGGAFDDPAAPPAPPDKLSTFHQAQQKRLDARMRRQQQLSDSNSPRISDSDEPVHFRDGPDDTVNVIALPLPPRTAAPQPLRPPASRPIAQLAVGTIKPSTPRPILNAAKRPPPNLLAPSICRSVAPLRRSDSAPNTSTINPLPLPAPAQAINIRHGPLTTDQDSPVPRDHRPATLRSKAEAPLKKWASLPLPLPTGQISLTRTRQNVNVGVGVRKVVGSGNGNGKKDTEADQDTGPWSREAADLFAWRPPSIASATGSGSGSALTA